MLQLGVMVSDAGELVDANRQWSLVWTMGVEALGVEGGEEVGEVRDSGD